MAMASGGTGLLLRGALHAPRGATPNITPAVLVEIQQYLMQRGIAATQYSCSAQRSTNTIVWFLLYIYSSIYTEVLYMFYVLAYDMRVCQRLGYIWHKLVELFTIPYTGWAFVFASESGQESPGNGGIDKNIPVSRIQTRL